MSEWSRGQRDCLLFGSAAAALAVTWSGAGLLWTVAALAAAGAVCAAVSRVLPENTGLVSYMPVWLLVPELLFLMLAAAKTASHAAACWPGHASWQLFALVLLALAGAASEQGSGGIGRCAVLLCAGAAVFYIPVLPAALCRAEPSARSDWKTGIPVLLTALTPICGMFLPSKGKMGRLLGCFAVFALLLGAGIAGKDGPMPFLTAVKGITAFGTLQRFEALASCVLTAGLFLMLCLFAAAGGEIIRALGAGDHGGLAVVICAAAAIWWADAVAPVLYAVGAALFWGILPLLTLPVVAFDGKKKTCRKSEKRS